MVETCGLRALRLKRYSGRKWDIDRTWWRWGRMLIGPFHPHKDVKIWFKLLLYWSAQKFSAPASSLPSTIIMIIEMLFYFKCLFKCSSWSLKCYFILNVYLNVMFIALADLHSKILDAHPLPPSPWRPKYFNSMQFFWENLAKLRVHGPPHLLWRVHAPTSGKSWIRHCIVSCQISGGMFDILLLDSSFTKLIVHGWISSG